MAGEEKQQIVIEILEDASKFGAGARAAIEAAMKDMGLLGQAAERAAESVKKVASPNLMDPANASIRMTDQLMKQYGMTVEEAARKAAEFWGGGKKAQEDMAQQILKTIAATDVLGKSTQEAAQKAVQGMQAAEMATSKWAGALRLVKGILTALGVGSALQILRTFISFLREAVTQAEEFSLNQYRLQVGVRAFQREVGLAAGSTQEWAGFVQQLRKQFRIFSLSDLTAATAKVILLTRELGFTKEQMQEVTKASIILAEVSGRDVEDAARRLALFLDTGYARGLAQLGVQVSKASVEQYALAHGINKTWNEMTRAERATVGLNAVLEQTGRLAGDAGLAADTLRGQFQSLQADQKDAMIAIGQDSAFLFLAWERIKTFWITDFVPTLSKGMKAAMQIMILGWTAMLAGPTLFIIQLKNVQENFWDIVHGKRGIAEVFAESVAETQQILAGFVKQTSESFFPAGGLGDVTEEEMVSMASSVLNAGEVVKQAGEDDFKKFGDDVREAFAEAAQASEDMKLDMKRDFDDLAIALDRDLGDALTKLLRDLEDVERDYNQKRADLIADASRNEREATREAVDRRTELMAEYRLREIQDQREFNLEMAQLEREYLFSLEDAVRERDARAVLMLMRKHNIDVAQRNEDFAEKRRQARENLELELAQARQAEAKKRQEIRESLNKQLADLQRNFYLQSQEKYRNYLQELEDIRLRDERAREDLKIEYKRREDDLEAHLRNRLFILSSRFAQEFGLTASFVSSIMGLLSKLGGAYSSVLVGGMLAGISSALPSAPALSGMTRGGTRVPSRSTTPWPGAGHAEGGLAIANKATPAVFGEAGPEAAMFIPLNRLKEMGGGFGAGGRDRISLDINVEASPELVVSIIDRTMSEIAEVITRSNG